MFIYRVKVEELTAKSLALLKFELNRSEMALQQHYPIRAMSVVESANAVGSELDIYLALDDLSTAVARGV